MSKRRTTLPLVLSTAVGLSAVGLMFALPGEAAPVPGSFSAEARGDVWKVNRIDLDMSGDPTDVNLEIAQASGKVGQAAAPNRAQAAAHNLVASTPPSGQKSAVSTATGTQDTTGSTSASGAAGTVPGVVTYQSSMMTARGRWGGDSNNCLDGATALTQSTSASQGSGVIPAAIPSGTPPLLPIPVPTTVPTEIPTTLPTGFPTDLPSDLPTLTLPTDSISLPTESISLPTESITLPTELPTTGLPTLPLPRTQTLEPAAQAAEGDVSMVEVASASLEEKTFLQAVAGSDTTRRVYAETVGHLTSASAPAVTFFGGEAVLTMTGDPKLTAYSTGGTNGSQVDWTPPTMKLVVDGEEFVVPTDGSALALPYSQNEDVVLTVSAGTLSRAESAQGVLAQASVSVLDILIKNGDSVALDATYFPMSVKAAAPQGGVECAIAVVEKVNPKAKLVGKNNGKKADKLKLKAIGKAAGAQAKVFRVVKGKKNKKVAAGKLNAKGDRAFKIKDKNGKKATKYIVKVAATDLTTKAVARKKLR